MFLMNCKNKLTRQGEFTGSIFRQLSVAFFVTLLVFFSCSICAKENEIIPDAVRWYQDEAAKGNVQAKYNLGMMNETGWSVPVDIEKAIRWYRDAANEGHAEAQLRLGMIYYLALGSNKSKIKGRSWIHKAADQGNEFAEQLYKGLFNEDVPDTIDRSEILSHVRKIYLENGGKAGIALKKLIADARQKIQILEKRRKQSTIKERREARVSIKDNDAKMTPAETISARKTKADRIRNVLPEFVADETLKENRTLERGNIGTIRFQAQKGQASAQYNLGRMFDLGIKVPVNRKKAFAWYEKSAAQGYADAEYRLAIAYLYGIIKEKNEELGMKWLSSAASHGHQVAKNLQEKLESSEGLLLPDQSIAVKWYLERAVAGDAESALRLGKIFQYGWGVMPDLHEAIKWYQRASVLGAKEAGELLHNFDMHAIGNGPSNTSSQSGSDMPDGQPPNWIAYILASIVAALIFFWPSIARKVAIARKRKTDSRSLTAALSREEPPFT
jgi:TPR repeat protein